MKYMCHGYHYECFGSRCCPPHHWRCHRHQPFLMTVEEETKMLEDFKKTLEDKLKRIDERLKFLRKE